MVALDLEPLSAEIFRAWLSATQDGAIAVDADGMVVLHNGAASRVTGIAPPSAIGRPWRDVLKLDTHLADILWEARSRTEGMHTTAQILCAQGNLRSADLQANAWTDRTGRNGVLIVVRDLAVLCRQRIAPANRPGYGSLVGQHPRMLALFDQIDALAPSDAPVIIEGETGTGKELVAQLIHARSDRAERPFMVVNCSALSASAVEAEMFGTSRGSNGHPAHVTMGRLELAHTGSLLLDEVGALPMATQARLLRFLAAGELERVGDAAVRRVDVRILATTTRPLLEAVRAGRFREDLFYRLKVVKLEIPPLRERLSDVPELVDHFLARAARSELAVAPAALGILQTYRWPGNVRELENAVKVAAASARTGGSILGPECFPADLRDPNGTRPLRSAAPMKEDRRTQLLRALSSHGGNRTAAARALGIGRATFYRWWRDAGL